MDGKPHSFLVPKPPPRAERRRSTRERIYAGERAQSRRRMSPCEPTRGGPNAAVAVRQFFACASEDDWRSDRRAEILRRRSPSSSRRGQTENKAYQKPPENGGRSPIENKGASGVVLLYQKQLVVLHLAAMRIALYARVSTKDKGQDHENQLRELREFVSRKASDGWTMAHECKRLTATRSFFRAPESIASTSRSRC
jgi:hypothetical protein